MDVIIEYTEAPRDGQNTVAIGCDPQTPRPKSHTPKLMWFTAISRPRMGLAQSCSVNDYGMNVRVDFLNPGT